MNTPLRIMLLATLVSALAPTRQLLARGGGGMGGGMGAGSGYGSMNRYGNTAQGMERNGNGRRATDTDGDGVVNGQDPDYVRPQDGTGRGATDYQGAGTGSRLLDGTGPHGKPAPAAP